MSIQPEPLKFNKYEKGFTLVEALVALVILSVAIVPALYLSTSAVNAAFIIRDDMVASGLVQEGIEVVVAMRDSNIFHSRAFDTGLAAGTYRVQWNSTSLITLAANPPLELQNGVYSYDAGTDTQFTRTITITKVSSAELQVVSAVTWTVRGGSTRTVSAEDHLFNW